MIIFGKSNGDIIKIEPSIIYQGSNKISRINFIAPFSKTSVVEIKFELPNLEQTRQFLMTHISEVSFGLNSWCFDLEKSITQYAGIVKLIISVKADNNEVLTECKTQFKVKRGEYIELPEEPDTTVYDDIIIALSQIHSEVANKVDINYSKNDTEQKIINNLDGLKLVKTVGDNSVVLEVSENGLKINNVLITDMIDSKISSHNESEIAHSDLRAEIGGLTADNIETRNIALSAEEKATDAKNIALNAKGIAEGIDGKATEALENSEEAVIISEQAKTIALHASTASASTFNFYDSIKLKSKRWGVSSVRPDRVYFLCKPGILTKIKIKADIFFISTTSENLEGKFKLILNSTDLINGIVHEETFELTEGTLETTVEFEYEFYPEKEDNNILVLAHAGTTDYLVGTSGITNFEATICGANVVILNRRNEFRVFLTKDIYYITKNTETSCEYLCAPSDNVDLSAPFTTLGYVTPLDGVAYYNKLHPFNFMLVPKITYDTENDKYVIDSDIKYFYFSYSYNQSIYFGKENSPLGEYPSIPSRYGFTYTVGHPLFKTQQTVNLGVVNSNLDSLLLCSFAKEDGTDISQRLSFNGSFIPGVWVDNCAVFAKDWQDFPGERPNCYVASNSLGELYFFPSHNSDYNVYIGKGCRVNAFMQSDLSITVYYCWLSNVYKKTLKPNSVGIYELQEGEEIIENALEFIEGNGNDYFINRLGVWEYVAGEVSE